MLLPPSIASTVCICFSCDVALQRFFQQKGDRYRVIKKAIEEDQAHKNPLYSNNQFWIRLIKVFMKSGENGK